MSQIIGLLALLLSLILQCNGLPGRPVPGGITEVHDPVQRTTLANNALQEFEKLSNLPMARKIVEIVKVETQVVAGILYTVTYKLAVTQCARGVDSEELKACPESEVELNQLCTVTIWEQVWINFKEVQSSTCTPNEKQLSDSMAKTG